MLSCSRNMLVNIILITNFVIFEGFCFQHQENHSVPKWEDFVWFEEPDIKTNTNDFKTKEYFKQNIPSSSLNLEDLVWFATPDFRSFQSLDFVEQANHSDDEEVKYAEENLRKNDDEIFAEYFFANKWK